MQWTTAAKIRSLKSELKRKIAATRRQASDNGGRVNVAGRVDAVVVWQSGRASSVQVASSRQHVHIRQSIGDLADEQRRAPA